jgi:hypothetical protein
MRGRDLIRRASAATLAAGLALSVASARGASHDDGSCTWGASSITAQFVDGKLVQSEPVTTGCAPG